MAEPNDCDHPLEACYEGKCWMCGWTYDPPPELRYQRQDSLTAQMKDVERAAVRMGCYDAADWIRQRWTTTQKPPRYPYTMSAHGH